MATLPLCPSFNVEASSIHRSQKSFSQRAITLVLQASNFFYAWTPFALVSLYFTISISLYTFSNGQTSGVFWFVYMATNFYIAGTTVLEAFLSRRPFRESVEAQIRLAKNEWSFPTPDDDLPFVDIILVAYLPNEHDIILGRIYYLLNELAYPKDKIRINVVYNTPVPLSPLEEQLTQLATKHSQLRIVKVLGSTSKAENLNYFFTLDTGSDFIGIYDCDHFPHPYATRWAVERFMAEPKVSIVQGRCIVYNASANLLANLISIEFDKIYAVSHPGRATQQQFGLFTGSNGYWKTGLLRQHGMDGTMLTEDIDSALRALGEGYTIVHDLNVVSYETAPTTVAAFWKQRLRWTQGWTQVSIKHIPLCWRRAGVHGFSQHFGIFSLLFVRELSYYLVTQQACLIVGLTLGHFPRTGAQWARLVFFQYPVSQWLFILSLISFICVLYITAMARSEFATRIMFLKFALVFPFYIFFLAVIGLYGHARYIVGYSKWNPTART